MKKLLLFILSLFMLGIFTKTYSQEPPSYMSPNSLEGHGNDEDLDNDGVLNLNDLDKDNDGILDADECDVSTTAREFNIIAPPIYRTQGFIYWFLNIKGTPSTLVEFNGNDYQISASGTLTITLESQDIPIAINNSPQENQVLRLIAEEPVSIIQELASLNNADAWTVIPEKLWGTQYRLFSEYGINQDNYQYAMIVSNSEDNEILIKNKNGVVQEEFTLNQGRTFLLRRNNTDLNGWTVESNKPVGVVIGSGCVSTPNGGCDSMFEMLTPIQFLGERYYLPNMSDNKTFVMAEYANTTVSLNGSIVSTLPLAGDVFEFTSSVNDKQIIETSQPATVWQMQDINGNPAWLKLFDENKAVQEFEFTIPHSNSLVSKNKLHIVVPTSKIDEIRINGNPVVSSEWILYPYDTDLSYCIKSELNPSSTWKVTSTSGLVPIIANYIGGSSGFTMSMAMTIGSYNVKSGAPILANCQDTDGDGIPDYLDLDSDNDGCNDAYEAYGTLDLSFGNGQIVNVDAQGKVIGADYPGNHINVTTPGNASTFISHPVDSTIELEGNITLTAEVYEGSGETFYQWQISTDNGTTWLDLLYDETYQNVLTKTLVINNPTNEMNGYQFRLKTMQSDYVCGERVSNSATLCVVDKAIINDVNATCSVVIVQAQQPTFGTGSWSVISGEGGQFANSNAANTTFTGVAGTTYVIRWTVQNGSNACQSIAEYTIQNMPTAVPNAEVDNFNTCFSPDLTLASIPTNGQNIVWYDALINGSILPETTILTSGEIYYAVVANGECESLERTAVLVTLHNPSAPSGEVVQTFCLSQQATIEDLLVNGNDIQWYTQLSGGVPLDSNTLLHNNTTYYASQKIDGCESYDRLAVQVQLTVVDVPTTANTTPLFCVQENATLASIAIDQNHIVWYDQAVGGNILNSSTLLVHNTTYYAVQKIGDCESVDRLAITPSIQTTPSPTVAEPTVVFCQPEGKTVADLGASGAGALVYYFNGTTVNATDVLQSGVYTVKQIINGCESVDGVTVNVTIHNTPAPTGETTQSFCEMNNPTVADLVATGTTSTGTIVWYGNPNSSTPLASTEALVDGATYYAVFVDNDCPSAIALAVTVSISEIAMPNISAVADLYCSDEIVSLGQLGVTGQNLKWFNESGAEIPATTMIANGETYYVSQTIGDCESARASFTIHIQTTPSPTVAEPTVVFCQPEGKTVADLGASGAGALVYYFNGAIVNLTDVLQSGVYTVKQIINGCESVDGVTVNVTIHNTPAPTGETTQSFCEINNPTVADLVATGTTSTGALVWYGNPNSSTPLASTEALVDGATYYAVFVDNDCPSATSLAVTVSISEIDMPNISAVAELYCSDEIVSLGQLGVTGQNLKWFNESGAEIPATTMIANGETYYVSQTIGDCESARASFTINIQTTPAPTVAEPTVVFCQPEGKTVADLGASGAGALVYYFNGTTVNATDVLQSGVYTVKQIINGCESVDGVTVNVTIHNTPAPTGETTQSFCEMNNPTVADLVATGTTSTGAIVWYGNPNLSTPLALTEALIDGSTYYAVFVDNDCPSATFLAVTVSISEIAMPNISAVADLYCSDEIVSLGQLGVTGQNLKWFNESGAEIPATTMIANGKTYSVSQTIGSCESARASFTINIQTTPAPTVAEPTVVFCQPEGKTVADLGASGAGALVYYFNGAIVNLTDVLQSGVYTVKQIINGCESINGVTVNVTIHNTPAPTGDTTQSFCEINNPTIADLVVAGATSTGALVWYANQDLSTPLALTEALVDGATYYAVFVDNDCPSAIALAVTVSISEIAMPNISAVAELYCSDEIVSLGELGIIGQNLKWFNELGAEISATTMIANGKTYSVSQTIGSCESARASFTIHIQTTPAPTVERTTVEYCQQDDMTVADLGASGAGTLVYYFNGAIVNLTDVLQSGVYTVKQIINGCESINGVTVNVTIHNTPAPIGETTQSFCEINNPTIADLVVAGATSTGTIVWYANQDLSTPLALTEALIDGSTYYAVFVDNDCPSAIPLAVTVSISEIAMPNISAVADLYCSDEIVSLGQLGVTGQNLKWFNESGAEIPATTMIANGKTYSVSQTIGSCESARASFTINIQTTPAPTVAEPTVVFCQPEGKTVADLGASGAGTLVYYFNGTTVNATDVLQSGVYTVKQIINGCESINGVTVNVTIHNTPAPTGEATQSFCEINNPTVADLVATGTTSTGAIVWYGNPNLSTPLALTEALIDGATYYAVFVDNDCPSATFLAVTVSISEIDMPNISAVADLYCSDEIVSLGELGIIGQNLKWFNELGAEISATTMIANGKTYSVSQTIGSCESARATFTINIQTTPAPTVAEPTVVFCQPEGKTVADLGASGAGTLVYYFNGTTVNATDVLQSGVYTVKQIINGCESINGVTVNVTIHNTPAPTGETTQSFCEINNPTIADLVVNGTAVKWYASIDATVALPIDTALEDGVRYFASQTTNDCESESRLAVTVSINEILAPTIDNDNPLFCIDEAATLADISVIGSNVKWYTSLTDVTPLLETTTLVDGVTYYATQTINGCESVERLAVTVQVQNTPAPTTTQSIQEFCIAEGATLSDLEITGEQIKWYNGQGELLPSTIFLINGTTYFASQTINTCESVERLAIEIVVYDTAAPTTIESVQSFCMQDAATLNDLVIDGENILWYNELGDLLPSTTLLENDTTYYATQTLNECESVEKLAIQVSVNETPSPTTDNTIQEFCVLSPLSLNELEIEGENIQWYTSAVGGELLEGTTIVIDGTTYYASQTINGCESVNRLTIQVAVKVTPLPILTPNQEFCVGDQATLASVLIDGENIIWYNAAEGGNMLPMDTILQNGISYFATQTIDDCETISRVEYVAAVKSTPAPQLQNTIVYCDQDEATIVDIPSQGQTLVWYDSLIATVPLANTTLLVTGTYYAAQIVEGCESVERTGIEVEITDTLPIVPEMISTCSNSILQDVILQGYTFEQLEWYSSEFSTSQLSGYTILNASTILYVNTLNGSCKSERVPISIEMLPIVPQPMAPSQYICGAGTVADLVALGANGATINWYNSATADTPLSANTSLVNGTYYVSQTLGSCTSTRRAVQVIVVSTAAPIITEIDVCQGETIADVYIYTPVGSHNLWYVSPTATTPLDGNTILINGTYYIERSHHGCVSERAAVQVNVHAIPNAPTGEVVQSIEMPGVVGDIVMNESNVVWYFAYESAIHQTGALSNSTPLINGHTYYGVLVSDAGCVSEPTGVTVNLYLDNESFDLAKLRIYPNPTTDFLNISYYESIDRVEVYSLLGQRLMNVVVEDIETVIDMTSLASSTYMVRIWVGESNQLVKVIKK